MSAATGIDPGFAEAMHDLSAHAEPSERTQQGADVASGISAALSAVHGLGQRIEALEETVARRLETINLAKIGEDVTAIRECESVNQQLFDSLHEELNGYRDNLLRESLQKPFIRDLLVLLDDLSAIIAETQDPGNSDARPQEVRLRENLDNLRHFLMEIFHRLEVTEIEPREKVDRALHKVAGIEPTTDPEEDGVIVRQIKPGFSWHERVLRPAEVVIKRLPSSSEA